MLKRSRSWITVPALGERCRFSLRYQNGFADTYEGYDPIDTTPIDGITSAFFSWVQMVVLITISRIEERKNAGEYQMIDLLEEKANQAMDGIQEKFNRGFLQGNGINSATAITTPYTSSMNGSLFLVPLPALIANAPTAGTVGSIPCNSTSDGKSYWANQQRAATDTNYASFLKDLTGLYNDCSKGPGGGPDMNLTDQATSEFYEAALRSQNRYTETLRADIPFDNVAFRGKPLVWDEFMPNWSGGTTVQSATQGTWLMVNSRNLQVKYDGSTNFLTTPFIRPDNQDAQTCQILWYGSAGVNNRRKHGVLSDINTTLTT